MKKQLSSASLIASFLFLAASFVGVNAAPGDLDTSFGIQGQLRDTTLYRTRGGVVQPDGKIVVVGSIWYTVGYVTFEAPSVVRFNTDGALDHTFGTAGAVRTTDVVEHSGYFDGVVLQGDGKIVATGYRGTASFVVRLNADGSFDTTFSGDGKFAFNYPAPDYNRSRLTSVAIASNGKIVVAGTVEYDYVYDPYHDSNDIFVARLNADGTLDSTFGTAGKQIHDHVYDTNDIAVSMAIHPGNGKIALALEDDNHIKVALLNTDGSLDTSFSNNGYAAADFGYRSLATTIAFQRWLTNVGGFPAWTYRIVVGGWAYESSTTVWDFALARFKLDGSLDNGFDGDGKVRKALSYQSDMIRSIRIDASARIVAAGVRRWNNVESFAVVRFTRDGAYDTTFGNQGKVYTSFFVNGTQVDADGSSVALGPDGKIVVAGGYWPGDRTFLARYEP